MVGLAHSQNASRKQSYVSPIGDAHLAVIYCHREYEAILESNAKETPSNITCERKRKGDREIYLYVAA